MELEKKLETVIKEFEQIYSKYKKHFVLDRKASMDQKYKNNLEKEKKLLHETIKEQGFSAEYYRKRPDVDKDNWIEDFFIGTLIYNGENPILISIQTNSPLVNPIPPGADIVIGFENSILLDQKQIDKDFDIQSKVSSSITALYKYQTGVQTGIYCNFDNYNGKYELCSITLLPKEIGTGKLDKIINYLLSQNK